MKSQKLMVLFVIASITGLYNLINAEFLSVEIGNTADGSHKENKTVIELKKNITGVNLDISFAQLNHTEASNIPKIRKVTPVDNNSLERNPKTSINPTEEKKNGSTTTASPLNVKILTEAGMIALKESAKNITYIKINSNLSNANNNINVKEQENDNITTATVINKQSSSTRVNGTTAEAITSIATNFTNTNITPVKTLPILNGTSTSTINITTPKPKKPTITYSVPDFPDLEKANPEISNLLELSPLNKLPLADGPYTQPSKEFNSNFHHSRDFILPIVSMLFIIPLIIGILITSYRRFRDCWSTRHYRRMDFLVDGMYND